MTTGTASALSFGNTFPSRHCHEICTVILHLRGVDRGLCDTLAANGRLILKSQQAEPLMAEGKFQDAIAVFHSELNEAVPNNPGSKLNLGVALHLADKKREVIPGLR